MKTPFTSLSNLHIAIVHEWFDIYRGSERVVEQMLNVFPQADLFALVDFMPSDKREFMQGKTVTTSFLQRLPFARGHFRSMLPLMPIAIEQFDLSPYDLILSSSHAVAKGVLVGPDQLHISYIHSPMRYAWDMQGEYLQDHNLRKGIKSWLARGILHYMRLWDTRSVQGVDHLIANSHFVARRIEKVYRREAKVIYPPVDVDRFEVQAPKEDFYLAASRLEPYKQMDLIVQAFAGMPDKRLVVIGDGSEYKRLKNLAPRNVEILGYQDDNSLKEHLARAKAFLFAAIEDFGILPVEAQACGTPVIAYGRGGVTETVRTEPSPQPTGMFFYERTPEEVRAAVLAFEECQNLFSPDACRKNALHFSVERFQSEYAAYVKESSEIFLDQNHRNGYFRRG